MERVGDDETCGAKRGVARGDRGDDNAKDSEYATDGAKPTIADFVDGERAGV